MMKKFIYFIILNILIINQICDAQHYSTQEQNLTKYWWYRYRFWNYFMVTRPNISDGGVFMLSNEIINTNTFNIGDGGKYMSQYLIVLATEYKLLKLGEQDYIPTLQELCCALEKLEQLDWKAEKFYECSCNYNTDKYLHNPNGFFIRDDIHSEFIIDNQDYFSHITSPNDWKVESDWTHDKKLINNYSLYDLFNEKKGKLDNEMSQDLCWFLLLSFAIIDELVEENEEVISPCSDKNIKVQNLAEKLTYRMGKYIKKHGWRIKNPCSENTVRRGGNLADVLSHAWDFAEAVNWITGKDIHNTISSSLSTLTIPLLDPLAIINADIGKYHGRYGIICLRAIHKNFLSSYETIASQNKTHIHLPLIQRIIHDDIENSGNLQSDDLSYFSVSKGNYKNGYEEWLDNAPFKDGTALNYYGPDYFNNYYNSTSVLNRSKSMNYKEVDQDQKDEKIFNGVDYMLLHNLHYLARSKSYIPFIKMTRGSYFLDQDNLDFPVSTPYGDDYQYRGTKATPVTLNAFDRVEASNTIEGNGDVTCNAGKKIVLKPGFHAKPGCHFKATIDPSLKKFNVQRYWDDEMHAVDGSVIEPVRIINAPSSFSPGELLCFTVENATHYEAFIAEGSIGGPKIYLTSGTVNGNQVCVFGNNVINCFGICTYYIIVKFCNEYDQRSQKYIHVESPTIPLFSEKHSR